MAYARIYSTLGSPELSLEAALALAGRHGLAGVEIRALAGTTDLPAHFAARFGEPAVLARAAAGRVVALDTSLKLAGGTAADREALLAHVAWAEALGGLRLRVFDGGKTDDAATRREMAETVAWWRNRRARHGWRSDLMVETHDTLFTAAAIREFLALAPGTGILWDTHHTWKKGGEAPVATWRAIAPQVVHVHVKDSVGRPSERHPFTYVPPGAGEFPMAALRPVLQEEFAGPVSLEWEKLWHPYLPPVDEALAAAERGGWW